GTLTPGAPSPAPPVPSAIPRPEYVGKATADEGNASDVYDAAGVERIRAAGRLAAQAMEHTAAHIRPGVTTDELDRIAHAF
ncbi:M24 family metallopeptidase, partial [Xanthomonas citri pv. citri]|nr:M24 family metallopeptidase [Xanthomonas citri pv. citri]